MIRATSVDIMFCLAIEGLIGQKQHIDLWLKQKQKKERQKI